MSTTRLDPRERVEQSQLAAALAASRQVEATPQQQPLPPPSATKYGDLGSGTLLTTTTETTATSTSGSAQGKISEDRLGLLSSLGGDDSISKSNERRHIEQQTTPRMLSPSSTRPSARAPKRTLIDDDGDLSLPPAAALNAAAHASELGSALKTNIPAANDTIMADDTAEVIDDSDEESRPSSYILSDVSQLPPAKPVERASTATSSIVDPTASSAIPGPSKPSKASRTSDPIAMTTTTATSSSSRTASASKPKNMLQDGFDLEIVVAPNPPRRTLTAASKSGAPGKSKARDSITLKASKKRDAESSEDTDYDTLPGEKAAKKTTTSIRRKETNTTERVRGSSRNLDHDDNAALPRKKNRARTSTIMRASPSPRLVKNGAEEEMPVSDASEDPLLIRANDKSESSEHPHGGASRPPKGRRPIAVEDSEEEGTSVGGDDAGGAVATGGGDADSAAPKRNGPPKRGGSSDSRRVAVSEDEDGVREAQEAVLRAIEQADEMDDDYGGPGRKATKKGKAAAKKRVRTGSKRGAEGDEVAGAAPSNPKLRRPPTITKDDVPVKEDPPASSSVSPETTRSGRPSRNKPKRLGTSFVNESPIRRAAPAPPVPAIHGKLPPLPPMGDVSSISSAIPAADQPAPGRTASKKRSVVHASEEEEGEGGRVEAGGPLKPVEGLSAVAGDFAMPNLQTGGKQDQPATTAGTTRRGKPKPRKQVVQSSDAEEEGAVSDATSAIKTGDEFSDDDDGGTEKPPRGGKKGKEAARPARADSTASKSSTTTKPTANKRPRLSTSPNRARGRSASTEERIEQMMKAAAGDEEQSLLKPASRSSTAKGVKKAAKGVTTDNEEEEEEEKARTSSPEAESKENEGSAIRKNGNENGTPVAARARSASGTPFSKAPRPGSLAAIMAKKGLATFRAPGLSARQRVPPLHTNLKPPPPAKKALPEKKVKKKKGDESYSDEEKPWYKRKDPEEWDDEDHRRWQKRLRRIDRGLPPDSDDD